MCTVYASFWASTATSRWLLVKWRHFEVTSGHLSSRDVISYHVTESSIELQPWSKGSVQYTRVFDLQPLPGDLRSSYVNSGSLPVAWNHITSFPVLWLPPPATYSFVVSEKRSSIRDFLTYSHFLMWSGQMTSLPGQFRLPEITWSHCLSRDCLFLQATALYEAKCTVYASFGLPQPLSGDFQSNDVTFGTLPVTLGYMTSFPITSLPPASYSFVGSEMFSIRVFGHLHPLPGDFRSNYVTFCLLRSHDLISCHVTAFSCALHLCSKWNVQYTGVFGFL